MFKSYRKGKRTYTRIDNASQKVTVQRPPVPVPGEPSLRIDVPDGAAAGVGSDVFAVHSNRDEFVVDCLRRLSPASARVVCRAVMSPVSAKRFAGALRRSFDGRKP
jgi:hypothetical protein